MLIIMNMFEDYLPGQRPPREHPLRRMAEAEWTQIGMGLDALEDLVMEVCMRVRAYHVIRHCVTHTAADGCGNGKT